MYAVRDRADERKLVHLVGRVSINLPSSLEAMGRSLEAVAAADHGIEVCHRHGLADSGAWVYANQAQSFFSLGHWERSESAAAAVERLALIPEPKGLAAVRRTELAIARETSPRRRSSSRSPGSTSVGAIRSPSTRSPGPAHHTAGGGARPDRRGAGGLRGGGRAGLPDGHPAGRAAAAPGRRRDRGGRPRAARHRAGAPGGAGPDPLKTSGGCPCSSPSGPRTDWRSTPNWPARRRRHPGPLGARGGRVRPLSRPYELAQTHHRWAEALLTAPGDRSAAADLLRGAHTTADRLGARPLAEAVRHLAARARISWTPPGRARDADPARRCTPRSPPSSPSGSPRASRTCTGWSR